MSIMTYSKKRDGFWLPHRNQNPPRVGKGLGMASGRPGKGTKGRAKIG
jgi:hypothetical protein